MNDRDVLEKAAAQAQYANKTQGAGSVGAMRTECGDQPLREGMIGSLHNRLARAQRESRKAEQLSELLYLLDKNPETARILDLVDAVGRDY